MSQALQIIVTAISAIQADINVSSFMTPYALAGRIPTDAEIDLEHLRLIEDSTELAHVEYFKIMCQKMRADALLLTHAPGRA